MTTAQSGGHCPEQIAHSCGACLRNAPAPPPNPPRLLSSKAHPSLKADDSVDIYDKLEGVGAIGGIVGTAVSASFLFLVAVINSWFLWDALRHRRARKQREALGLPPTADEAQAVHGGGCLVRIVAPILKAVDAPWKLYPVGVLFGFVSALFCEAASGASGGAAADSTAEQATSEGRRDEGVRASPSPGITHLLQSSDSARLQGHSRLQTGRADMQSALWISGRRKRRSCVGCRGYS